MSEKTCWSNRSSKKPVDQLAMCVHGKLLQMCLTLCSPVDCSLPGSSVHRILQARILEWLACLPLGDLPDPGIKPAPLMSPALAGRFSMASTTWEAWWAGDLAFILFFVKQKTWNQLSIRTFLVLGFCFCPLKLYGQDNEDRKVSRWNPYSKTQIKSHLNLLWGVPYGFSRLDNFRGSQGLFAGL